MPHLFHALPRIGRWPRLLVAGTCLLLALASAVGGHQAVDAPAATAQPVVVAARPLPAGHLLARADLALARWPTAGRPAGARSDPSTVAGRRLAGPGGQGGSPPPPPPVRGRLPPPAPPRPGWPPGGPRGAAP